MQRSQNLRQVATLGVVFVSVLVAACSKASPPPGQQQGPPPPQVGIVSVTPTTVPESYEFGGQVQPFRRVEVRSRVDGIIVDRPFTEGSVVSKGQVLYKLDQVKYDAAYRSALARLNNAKRTVARLEPLLPKHAVAQQDVDNAHSELESAQAAVDAAKKDLDDTVIRAEIDGQVGRARLELGARVSGPGDLLTTIDELDPVYVTFHPSSQQLASWAEGPARRRADSRREAISSCASCCPTDRSFRASERSTSSRRRSTRRAARRSFAQSSQTAIVVCSPGQFVRVRLEGFSRSECARDSAARRACRVWDGSSSTSWARATPSPRAT